VKYEKRKTKNQLIAVLILGVFLSSCSTLPAKSPSFPKNVGTIYEYSQDNIPDVCFFPVEKARWDGYKVTNNNWSQLTDFQKTMFISEAAEEIRGNERVIVDLKDSRGILVAMNKTVADIEKDGSNIEFLMIKLMHGVLKDSNQIKPAVFQDKSTKNNSSNVRVSGDVYCKHYK